MVGLKIKRKEKKLTQMQLGNLVGVAGNTITYYEKGKRDPSIDTLKKLAKFFDCTIDELM